MAGKYACPVCSHTFAEREAHCEDWAVPEKSFACPKCRTFFERRRNERLRWKPYLGSVAGLVAVAVATMYALHVSGRPGASGIASGVSIVVIAASNVLLARRFTVTSGPSLVPYPQQ